MVLPEARLELRRDGAEYFSGAAMTCFKALRQALGDIPANRAGSRIFGAAGLVSHLSATGAIGSIAAVAIGGSARPVRAILLDKTAAANWSLAWHQDRTIAVTRRVDVAGFGPWTTKRQILHVAPFQILAGMVTLRIHLDDVPTTNAPLLVAPGSHRAGRVAVGDIGDVVARCGVHACLATAGDVWIYSTPILHASEAARAPERRRVLQVDYAATPLPGGLEWRGL